VNPVSWYRSLPPAQTLIPCGNGTHPVAWTGGRLELPAHQDAEAERVLAALGGDRPRCLEVAETWDAHADDLDVLMSGPRSRADTVTVGWDEAEEHGASWLGLPPGLALGGGGAWTGLARGRSRLQPGSALPGGQGGRALPAGQPGRPVARSGPPRKAQQLPEELIRRVRARTEVLRLLALGPAFQFRLAGAVTAAWAADSRAEQRASRQPELTAALTGRAAPVIAQWLDVAPDAVKVTPAEGPPASPERWGSLQALGTGTNRLVRASLPVGWLASVWACGLALVGGHLVVAVEEPGWPRTRVLALAEPGAAPVPLDLTGTDADPVPHWTLSPPGPQPT
jgi:hypothetical protein